MRTLLTRTYQSWLHRLYRELIPEGKRVLELGCGPGDLLAAVKPSFGVGVDRDPECIARARTLHPHLVFETAEAEKFSPEETFDFIIMADLLVGSRDILALLKGLEPLCHPDTRICINSHNALWQGAVSLAEALGLKQRSHGANWLGRLDLLNLFTLADLAVEREGTSLLLPLPGLEPLNQAADRFPNPFHWIMYFVVKPAPQNPPRSFSVSVVVPTRNEVGNVQDCVERMPELGSGTEILFVDGCSTDGTVEKIQEMMARYPERNIKLLHQDALPGIDRAQASGKMLPQGKADAVRKGFLAAEGEILMICDADLTVAPEELGGFYDVIASGKADFVNGSRLLYPMEEGAMRYINLLGNKFFSMCFSWLLDNYVKDTLCGTKVLFRKDYPDVLALRREVGDFDPFGDFELLFGAAAAGLTIRDFPIHYRKRLHGQPKIENWKHSLLLFRMVWNGIRILKLSPRRRS